MTNNPLCPYCNTKPLIKKTCGHKSCQIAHNKAWRDINKEKISKQAKDRYEQNKEQIKAYVKSWAKAKKEKALKAIPKRLCPYCKTSLLLFRKGAKTCGHKDCQKKSLKDWVKVNKKHLNKQKNARYHSNKEQITELCPYCKKEPLFGKVARTCGRRPCQKENKKAWGQSEKNKKKKQVYRDANKDKMKVYHKVYYPANKEHIKEQGKTYRDTNKEKVKEQKKAYYEKNKEQISKQNKAYRDANKEKIKKICPICKTNKMSKNSKRCIKCSGSFISIARHSISYLTKGFKVVGAELYTMDNQKIIPHKHGPYYAISFKSKNLPSHRLIYTLEHKKHIKNFCVIDHINGNKLDNHPLNLRQVSFGVNSKLITQNKVRTCQIIYALEQADVCIYSFSDMVLKYENLRRRVYDSYKERHMPQIGLTAGGRELCKRAIKQFKDYKDDFIFFLFTTFKAKDCPYLNDLLYFAHNWKRLYGMGKVVGGFIADNEKAWDTLREQALKHKNKKDFGFY